MINRYQASVLVWNRRNGYWDTIILGQYKTRARARARLLKECRHYTRYERHPDYGEVLDIKTGLYEESSLDIRWDVPTVGDLGWTP